jgi:hypothetical protein
MKPRVRLVTLGVDDLARDTGLAQSPRSPTDKAIGHNVASRAEVDEVLVCEVDDPSSRGHIALLARRRGDARIGA